MSPKAPPSIPSASVRHPAFAAVPDDQWNDWRWQMRTRITSLEALSELVALTEDERVGIEERAGAFGFAITPYYLSLIGGLDRKSVV